MGDELKKYEYFIKLDTSNIKDGTNIEKSIDNYKKHTRMLEELREIEYEKNLLILEENYKLNNGIHTAIEEHDRLETIIKLIEERIKQRNITKKEYDKVLKPYDKGKDWFFKELENDIEIKDSQNLENYADRLKKMKVFIKRNEDIIALREKNNNAEIALKDALAIKNTNDTANNILENDLQSFFAENFYTSTELDDIELEELLETEKIYVENIKLKEERILKKLNIESRANPKSKEIKEKLKHERDSIKALKTNHYLVGNKIRMISLSALVETECFDYDAIKSKREKILNVLGERDEQIKKYRLQEDSSNYHGLGVLVEKQLKEIKSQEKNNKLVRQLRESISRNNQEIEKLELANNEPEYQDISMEFASSYSNLPQDEDNFEPVNNFEQNYIIEDKKELDNKIELTEDQIKAIKEALLQYNIENKPVENEENILTEINDTPDIKYDNWENNKLTDAEPITQEDEIKESHISDIPVISFNQTLDNNKSNSVIENEKDFVPLTDYEEQAPQEENDEYNLDSFIPDEESYYYPNEQEEENYEQNYAENYEEENDEYNLDDLIDTADQSYENENVELNDEEGLDALIERASPTNDAQEEEYNLDNLIEDSQPNNLEDNIEDNTFASIVSVNSLPDEIKNNNPRERGKDVLKTVLEQLGIDYENTKPKRRSL